ncbi:MAG: TolC family protein, partial [Candidatus Cryptobacteroides sp.]
MRYGSFLMVYGLFLTGIFPVCAYSQDRVTLTMEDCRRMAAENNNAVRNSRLDVTAAKARKGEALAEYFPQVSLNAFGFHAIDPMLKIGLKDILGDSDAAHELANSVNDYARLYGINSTYSTLWHGYGASVSFIQPVFAGGRIVSGNRLASLGVKAAELQYGLQQRKSAEQIEEQYWQVVSLEEKMKTLSQVQTLLDTLQKDINAAVAAGVAVESDKLQVKLKMNELRSTRTKLRGGIRLAKMNLCNSIGQEYTPYSTIGTDSLPHIDSILLTTRAGRLDEPMAYYRDEEEIVNSREEKRLLEISVDAKRMEKRMVLGEVLPQIGIGGSYGYGALIGDGRLNGTLFATLKIPVTDWGKYARRL